MVRSCGLRYASIGFLAFGLLAFVMSGAIDASNKMEDAKKYTEQLKTTKDTKKKIEALKELGEIGRLAKSLVQDAVPYIKVALKDKDAGVRAAAAHAYGRTGPEPKEGVETLVKMLKEDPSDEVKIAATNGIAAMGSDASEARKDLQEVMREERKKDMKKQTPLARAAGNAARAIAPEPKKK